MFVLLVNQCINQILLIFNLMDSIKYFFHINSLSIVLLLKIVNLPLLLIYVNNVMMVIIYEKMELYVNKLLIMIVVI